MWRFLKQIFFEEVKKEEKKEEIELETLGEWYKAKTDDVFRKLEIGVGELREKIKSEILQTKEDLAVLNTAKLYNPKISVREKQFMEGNRKAYILSVNNFLRNINMEEGDYSLLLDFCDSFNLRLEKFGKSTIKSYQILQEFFAHESRNIAIRIKNIESAVKKLKEKISAANLSKINFIQGSISELNQKILTKKEMLEGFREESKKKDELLSTKEKLGKELLMLRKGKDYGELNRLKANQETILASIREHNARLVQAFSVMERPLRKLGRTLIEESELLNGYMENPVKALVADNELKITDVLKKLENNINNLTLELKDKKREKVLETVKGLTEEFLTSFVIKHNELEEKLEKARDSINDNFALKKENKLRCELENTNSKLEKVMEDTEGINKELGKINIDGMKANLAREINELLKTNIVIS